MLEHNLASPLCNVYAGDLVAAREPRTMRTTACEYARWASDARRAITLFQSTTEPRLLLACAPTRQPDAGHDASTSMRPRARLVMSSAWPLRCPE